MTDTTISPRTPVDILTRLSIMMFFQFFVWGAWYVTLGTYMGEKGLGASIGNAYTVGPIAAIISPFFLGMVADRYFATQRVLGALHIVGGLALLAAPKLAQMSQEASRLHPTGNSPLVDPNHLPFLLAIFVHMLCFMPTLGLSNSISFAHIKNAQRDFPVVRVLGTIGWIVAGILVSKVMKSDKTDDFFYVAGGAGILLGLFSFSLPHTPPPSAGKKASAGEILGVDALSLMKSPSFAIFIVASLLTCIPLAGYYTKAQLFVDHAGFENPAYWMTFGQMSEIVFMLLIPFFFVRLGVKWMLAVGMLAWAVRYALFAGAAHDGTAWMILAGIILHGICYDFFFVTGFIYVERKAPPAIRAQAQGFLVLVTQGFGLGIGAQVFQRIFDHYSPKDASALVAQAEALRKQAGTLLETSPGATAEASSLLHQASEILLKSADWQMIWMIPAIGAAGILAFFVVGFHDKEVPASGEQ
ncbi:MAG: nucleoside permease [Planctomycetota bacterium]